MGFFALLRFGGYAVAALAAAALTANGAQAGFEVIHHFGDRPEDGRDPQSGLTIDLGAGRLYGTTYSGGVGEKGTVFEIGPFGGSDYRVLYRFNGTGGAGPKASVIVRNGRLYGTTYLGGDKNWGTIYELRPGVGASVLYSFSADSKDGYFPMAPLTMSSDGGTLYGVTVSDGQYYAGTAFSFRLSDRRLTTLAYLAVLGGLSPESGLLLEGQTLYGTAARSGSGSGIAFKVTVDGSASSSLFKFANDSARSPAGSLAWDGDGFVGTASTQRIGGAIYKVTTNSQPAGHKLLFSFAPKPPSREYVNGSDPIGGLTKFGDYFYGTTRKGGKDDCGTVFRFKLPNQFTKLHDFTCGGGGFWPVGNLAVVSDGKIISIYGTTSAGGAHHNGTVFLLRL